MARTLDMTKGKPLGLLTAFAVPLLFGNICQVLYSVADSTVVGRILGVEAFAAVGAAGFYSWLVLDIVLGFSQGLEVLLGQQFGKKDELGLHRAVAMSVLLAGALSILLTVCAQAAVEPVLSAAGTPEDIRAQTTLYLRWWLAGVPAMAAYNLCASLLRAMGNSRVPLISVIVSSVSNVALNLLFAAVFHWGVAGVAAAKAKIPYYVGADSMVNDGGFLSVGINYEELGKETANMVDQVLKGERVENIPVKVFKDNLNIYVNESVLNDLGIVLPESITNDESFVLIK